MKSEVSERLLDIPHLSKKELIQRAKEFSKQFRIRDGKDFKLKDFDPDEDGGLGSEDKPLAKQTLAIGSRSTRCFAGSFICTRQMGCTAHIPGYGCGG